MTWVPPTFEEERRRAKVRLDTNEKDLEQSIRDLRTVLIRYTDPKASMMSDNDIDDLMMAATGFIGCCAQLIVARLRVERLARRLTSVREP